MAIEARTVVKAERDLTVDSAVDALACPEAASSSDPAIAVEWCNFVSLARSVWNTACGGGGDAPLSYRTSTPVAGNGVYDIRGADTTILSMTVLVSANTDTLHPMGTVGSSQVIMAEISGPAGQIIVEAISWTQVIETGQVVSHVMPTDIPDGSTSAWLSLGDVWTPNQLAASGAGSCAVKAGIAFAAVYALYLLAFAVCNRAAIAAVVAAVGGCASLLAIPFVGWAAAAVCAAAAWAAGAAGKAACNTILASGRAQATAAALSVFGACAADSVYGGDDFDPNCPECILQGPGEVEQ